MRFWQNQVNFAVWCATAGCGVSFEDHLSAEDPLTKSLFLYHVYYQVRRVLAEIQAALPQDQAWSAFYNSYDRRAYERVCGEFGVSPNTDWRRHGVNRGLGKVFNYWTHMGYHVVGRGEYDSAKMSFTKTTTNDVLHVDYIAQTGSDGWNTFVLDRSEGLTRPGVERINDSIRTYVWAILGAQAPTRTRILGTGTAFDAQKQFLANLEDAIASPVDLPAAIKRYQDVLQYAGSKVDFVFGIGLYMSPSDMLLRIGQIHGYSNEIVVATTDQKLGFNSGLNAADVLVNPGASGETGLVKPNQSKLGTAHAQREGGDRSVGAPTSGRQQAAARHHIDEKTALIVGGVGVGLAALWAFDRL